MNKTPPIGVRLTVSERLALEDAAAADERSLSGLARIILADWLRERGWLKEMKP